MVQTGFFMEVWYDIKVFRRGDDLILLHSKISGEIEGTRRSKKE